MSAESNHAISAQATKDKIVHLLGYCRTCRTKNCLPAEHAEIMSRNQILQFLCKPTKETRLCICSGIAEHAGQHNCFACHKRQDCAFARVLQNMQDNKIVLPATNDKIVHLLGVLQNMQDNKIVLPAEHAEA
jgi:hypothetical protein